MFPPHFLSAAGSTRRYAATGSGRKHCAARNQRLQDLALQPRAFETGVFRARADAAFADDPGLVEIDDRKIGRQRPASACRRAVRTILPARWTVSRSAGATAHRHCGRAATPRREAFPARSRRPPRRRRAGAWCRHPAGRARRRRTKRRVIRRNAVSRSPLTREVIRADRRRRRCRARCRSGSIVVTSCATTSSSDVALHHRAQLLHRPLATMRPRWSTTTSAHSRST